MSILRRVTFFAISSFFLVSCKPQQTVITKTKMIKDTVFITKKSSTDQISNIAKPGKYLISTKNFPSISYNNRVRYLIMHYTVSDYPTSVKILTKKDVSSHYLVNDSENDSIDILVSEDKRAFHAGVSYWGGTQNLNDSSIGIEIVNKGFTKQGEATIYTEYPKHQIEKVAALAKDIIERYEIEPFNVIGHSDVAPGRKQDPGPKFPWKTLYEKYNLGAWYEDTDKQQFLTKFPLNIDDSKFISSVQRDLKKYGYDCKETGIWDANTKIIFQTFQTHFRPENYDGLLDAETWAILQALLKKYKK